MSRLLTDEEIQRQLGDLPGWRRDGESLVAAYDAPDFPTALTLIMQCGEAAEQIAITPTWTFAGRSRTGDCRRTPPGG